MYRVIVSAAALLILGVAAADARLADGPGLQRRAAEAEDVNTCNRPAGDLAIAACTRVIERNPRDAVPYYNRAVEYKRKGEHDRAIADLDQAIRLDPKYARAYAERGSAYNGKGEHDRAIGDLDQAIRLDPNYAAAYGVRGFAYNAKGEYDRAIADLDQAIRLDPKYAPAYNGRGQAYDGKGDYSRAIADFDQTIRLDPNNAVPYHNRGLAYYNKGDYDHAIADYDQAIRLDPKYAIAFSNRGLAYRDKQQYDRAISDYNQAISFKPELALAWNGRGNAYVRKSDYNHAIADYGQAILINSKNAVFYTNRGSVYNRKGDFDLAIADLDQAIRLDPKYTNAYNNRGFAYAGKGEHARAITDYDQAIRLDPNHAVARQNRERSQAALAAPAEQTKPPVVAAGGPERRVALVIGNSQYRSVAFLPNPRRDAQAVADSLRQVGFQSVELAMDLDRDGMVKALRSFRAQADQADWALIYYAGHGIEIDRVNYLIPTDAKLVDDRDVKTETVSYEEMLSAINSAKALRLVVLDACRVNPFKDQMRRTFASRGATDRGLAPPPESKPGTLVVYSAKDGEVAADGDDGVNSPFARAFVEGLKVPGREVRRLFDFVRDDVMDATNNRQQPFTYGSLPGRRDFFFVAGK